MPLPLLNGYYRQSTPPKAPTHSQELENSLNKNKEFMQNGCRIFHLEYDPSENTCMDDVWTQLIDSGRRTRSWTPVKNIRPSSARTAGPQPDNLNLLVHKVPHQINLRLPHP